MPTIHIKNIGPLIDTGKVELGSLTLFTGKQSSGKSTLMKILCFCSWIEKQIMLGDENPLYQYTHYFSFYKELKRFHRLDDSFFEKDCFIEYEGDCISIKMNGKKSNAKIERKNDFEKNRLNTKISFIPSERNLISAIKNVDKVYRSTELDILFNFMFEWDEARQSYTNKPLKISVADNMEYYYDSKKETDYLRLIDSKKEFSTFFASSGVQSALPIEAMINYFTSLINKPVDFSKQSIHNIILSFLQSNKLKIDELEQSNFKNFQEKLLNYQNVKLFIEEPEQNLYPESQKQLLLNIVEALIKANNISKRKNFIVMTTHSPYILSVLNVLMRAKQSFTLNKDKTIEKIDKKYIMQKYDIKAYHIENGKVNCILEKDPDMISGLELDSVSDWVEESITSLNDIIYNI